MFTNLITTKSSLLLVPNTMQKNRWQLIDPFIVKSCSVPVLTSEKCWSPGPEPVKEPAKIYLLFQNIFHTTGLVNYSRQASGHQILIIDVSDIRRQKQTKKKRRETKWHFLGVSFAYY